MKRLDGSHRRADTLSAVSKSQYSYPPDEFDVRGPEGSPVGVHREPRSGWSSVWPFLLVAVVCGGIAVGAVTFLSDDKEPSSPPAAEQSEGGAAEGDAEGTEEAPTDEESDAATEPEDEAAEGEGEESGEEEPADVDALFASADPTAPIRVVNSSAYAGEAVAGLAGKGAGALEAQGFTDVTPADAESSDITTVNTVYYVGDRAETAAAVAGVLGIPAENTQQVDALANEAEVTAVLGEDIDAAP
ncbi:hypothetical protein GCM10007368_06900 [Isoptericola cucumis]|uniref:LytR/CpsA/Psr regulator C-terminal domain-containing protein n=1 Tax=Isoptericola cucumis TaxID=1776856 RepID=A0ABQ2B5C5_9MICO|nr:hypothetical protein GCM10007368_06900 [Isoptericola cucumis]